MNIGEKIRAFREMRGLTQEGLGKLSGILGGTIRKYELGIRNPKQEQLIKIANGLGISVSVFYDFDLDTVGDVASLLFILDEQAELVFTGEKGEDGTYRNGGKVYFRFNNSRLNRLLAEWADIKEGTQNMKNVAKEGETYEGIPVDEWIENAFKEFKLKKMQNPFMLDTKPGEIKVKISNKMKD